MRFKVQTSPYLSLSVSLCESLSLSNFVPHPQKRECAQHEFLFIFYFFFGVALALFIEARLRSIVHVAHVATF